VIPVYLLPRPSPLPHTSPVPRYFTAYHFPPSSQCPYYYYSGTSLDAHPDTPLLPRYTLPAYLHPLVTLPIRFVSIPFFLLLLSLLPTKPHYRTAGTELTSLALVQKPEHLIFYLHGCSGAGKSYALYQSLIPAFITAFQDIECTLFISILEVRYESKKSVLYDLTAGHTNTSDAVRIANSSQRSAHMVSGQTEGEQSVGNYIHSLIHMARGRKMLDEKTVANPGSKAKDGNGSSASSRSEMTIMIVSLMLSYPSRFHPISPPPFRSTYNTYHTLQSNHFNPSNTNSQDIFYGNVESLELNDKNWYHNGNCLCGPANYKGGTPSYLWGSTIMCGESCYYSFPSSLR